MVRLLRWIGILALIALVVFVWTRSGEPRRAAVGALAPAYVPAAYRILPAGVRAVDALAKRWSANAAPPRGGRKLVDPLTPFRPGPGRNARNGGLLARVRRVLLAWARLDTRAFRSLRGQGGDQ